MLDEKTAAEMLRFFFALWVSLFVRLIRVGRLFENLRYRRNVMLNNGEHLNPAGEAT